MKLVLSILFFLFASTTFAQQGWIAQSSGTTGTLTCVAFVDSVTGIIGGDSGFLRTTNGGATRIAQPSSTGETIINVFFTDSLRGTAVGAVGIILRTTDGGTTWISQPSRTTNSLFGVYFTNASTGTVVGAGGTILRTTTGEVTGIGLGHLGNTVASKSFFLQQNFPNPFNPSTVISYRLSAISIVTLKVYDMLGREVATLVNEEKPAGAYTVNWNADVPSGSYFYRLQAGGFDQVRKMMVLK